MACAAEHAAVNFIAVTAACAEVQRREDRPVDGTSLAVGAAAACLPSLPDFLNLLCIQAIDSSSTASLLPSH